MDINKVEYNGENGTETLIDLTSDTVTPETLVKGATAHDKSGANIIGTADYAITSTSTVSPLNDSANGIVQGLTVKGKSRKTKNLLNITNPSKTQNGITFTVSADGTITVTGTATSMTTYFTTATPLNVLVQGESYVLSGCPANGGTSSYQIDLYAAGGYDPSQYVADTGNTTTFTAVDTELSPCRLRIASGYACPTGGLIFKPMICTVADYEADPTFEPYFEGIKSVGDNGLTVSTANSDNTLTTSAMFATALPLRSVSDTVRDKLICTANVKQVETVCREVDLGTLDWARNVSSITGYHFFAVLPQRSAIATGDDTGGICSIYTNSTANSIYKGTAPNKSIAPLSTGVYIRDDSYTDATAFKTAMSGVKFIYELAEPVTTPLTDAEISAFRSLCTYDSTTNITISDNPEFELDYLKNSDNGQAVADIQRDLQGQINEVNSQIDEIKNEKNHFCYSYKINLSDSNPATCVKPHFDTRYGCDNFSFTSAKMNYTTGVFDYGSWEGFIRRIARPCMLKYDGTVDYYLDPDDYSKKITGEASDVADVNYQGNAMVELEKLYFKRYTYNGVQYCFISDRKLDKSFKCWAHHDKYGKELDYIYRACYDGMYDGTRLRSISGVDYHNLNALTVNKIMSNTTRAEEIAFAQANNVASEQGEGWYILHKSEWDYINDILFLIGMSTDVQTTFGRGRDSGYVSTTNTGIISTGTMDDKGLFWGENDSSAGVKVLGFENHWANLYKSMAGYINASGTQKIKQTYGTEDGSAVVGFNTDGTGYVAIIGATPTKGDSSASGGGYITAWKYNDYGLIPFECTSAGSSAKFIPDYFYFNNNQTNFALVGGYSGASLYCGLFVLLNSGAGYRSWGVGAALSYKPLSARYKNYNNSRRT